MANIYYHNHQKIIRKVHIIKKVHQPLYTSFSHLCASVTKQYNLVPAKAGE